MVFIFLLSQISFISRGCHLSQFYLKHNYINHDYIKHEILRLSPLSLTPEDRDLQEGQVNIDTDRGEIIAAFILVQLVKFWQL